MNNLYIRVIGTGPIKHGKSWEDETQPHISAIELVQTTEFGVVINSMNLVVREVGTDETGLDESWLAMCVLQCCHNSKIIVPNKEKDWRLLYIAMRRFMQDGIAKQFSKLEKTQDAERVEKALKLFN
jgi:hypothetical protein